MISKMLVMNIALIINQLMLSMIVLFVILETEVGHSITTAIESLLYVYTYNYY